MRAPLRTLLALAWPIVVSRLAQTVVGLSDALLVAHLGPSALAATATGALDTFLVLLIPMGTTFIIGSFAAQLLGRGDLAGARRYGGYGLTYAVATAVVGAALIPALPWLFSTFSAGAGHRWGFLHYEPAMAAGMIAYLRLRLLGAGPTIGLEALTSYYSGIGKTRVPMIANVVLMTLNVALNWLFIDGHLGAPALGVAGSGLASALATWVAFAGIFVHFVRTGAWPTFLRSELWRTLRFGLPSGLNWFLEFLAFAYFANVVVVGLGTTQIAALNAVIQVNSASFMPAFGIASAGAVLVGQSIGRDAKDEVPRLVGLTFRVAAVWQGLVGALYLLMPALLMAPFATEPHSHAALMFVGVRMLRMSAAWQLFDTTATVLGEALRAAGDTVWPLWVRIAIAWTIFVPGTALTVSPHGRWPGDIVAMSWLAIYLGLLALALWWRYRSGAWRALVLVEPTVDTA